jgi:hypothetical protein
MRTAVLALAAAAILIAPTPARAELAITMHDGLVTVNAKDVTIRQILAEWAKVGQTRIVNAEGIAGGPVTLQLIEMPEEQALGMLLRSVSGYLAAPRPTVVKNASRYDRILVIPTAVAANPATRSGSSAAPPPAFPQPRVQPGPATDDSNDDQPPRNAPPPAPPLSQQLQQGPVFNNPSTFPPAINPQDAPKPQGPTPAPTAAPGTSAPGMITPVPTPPGQPGQSSPQR